MSPAVPPSDRPPDHGAAPAGTDPGPADGGPTPDPLGHTLRRGARISAVVMVLGQVVSFGQTLVLGRLLSPTEIGIFTAGTVLTGFFVTFSEGGLKGALIQRQDEDVRDTATTVFWATAASGIVMSVLALAAAPVISLLFGSAQAGLIAAVTSGSVFLHSLTTVPDGLMQRRFDFRRRMIVDPSVVLSFAVVSTVLCATGWGVWGMVVATYCQQVVWISLTWGLARWNPREGRVSYSLWRELARFSFPLVMEVLVQRVRDIAESVMVGRRLDTTNLGYYRYGRRLSMVPGTAVVEIASYVLFPAFSRMAGEPERLRRAVLGALGWVWMAAAPVAGLLVALGEPAVVLLLGERWRGAGVALTFMAGFGLGEAMNAVAFESMKGTGHSRRLNWTTALNLISGLGLLVVLTPLLGLVGVGLAISGSSILVGVTGLALARRPVGVRGRDILGRMAGPSVAAVLATAGTLALDRLLLRSSEQATVAGLGLVVAETAAFAAVYVLVLRVVDPRAGRSLFDALRGLARRGRVGPDGSAA